MDVFLRQNANREEPFLKNRHSGVDFFLRQNANRKGSVSQNPDGGVDFFLRQGSKKFMFALCASTQRDVLQRDGADDDSKMGLFDPRRKKKTNATIGILQNRIFSICVRF